MIVPGNGCSRVVVVEPGLRDALGHYFNLSFALAQECRDRAIPCVVYSNLAVEPGVAEAFPVKVIPHFHMGTYFGSSSDPLSGEIENFLQVDTLFGQDLRRLLPQVSASDIVVVPTASERIIRCFALAMAQRPPVSRPRVVLSFSFDPHGIGDPERALAMRMLYRAGFNALRQSQTQPWFTLVTNSALAEYQALADGAVHPVPIAQPSCYLAERFGAKANKPSRRPRITFLGMCHRRKGFHLLPQVIETVCAAKLGARFHVQVAGYGPGGGPDQAEISVVDELEDVARRFPGVLTMSSKPLTVFEYYRELGRADIVLAAYSPEYDQISGVYHEAVAFSKVVIARAGSVLERAASADGAALVVFDQFSAQSVADAVIRAIRGLDELRPKARQAAVLWGKDKGTGAYLSRILEYCAQDDARLPAAPAAADFPVWYYRMISPAWYAKVRQAIWAEPLAQPMQMVLDRLLTQTERDTGRIEPDLRQLAQQCGLSLTMARAAMQRLGQLGVVSRRPQGAGDRRLAWFLSPHLAWYGDLNLRLLTASETPEPLSVAPYDDERTMSNRSTSK